jgi:hypothetical protein
MWSFDTGDYPIGGHDVRVVAFNTAGESASAFLQKTLFFFLRFS